MANDSGNDDISSYYYENNEGLNLRPKFHSTHRLLVFKLGNYLSIKLMNSNQLISYN